MAAESENMNESSSKRRKIEGDYNSQSHVIKKLCHTQELLTELSKNGEGSNIATITRVQEVLEEWKSHGEEEFMKKILKNRVLSQEIIESIFVVEMIEHEIRNSDQPITIVDMCCGKGYLTFLLGFYFKKEMKEHTICAIDTRMGSETRVKKIACIDTRPFDYFNQHSRLTLTYRNLDIHSKKFKSYIENEKKNGKKIFLLGIHLCKLLSCRAVDLFNEIKSEVIILAPCCLPSVKKRTFISSHNVGACILCLKNAGQENYKFWDETLFHQLGSEFKYMMKNKLLKNKKKTSRHRYMLATRENYIENGLEKFNIQDENSIYKRLQIENLASQVSPPCPHLQSFWDQQQSQTCIIATGSSSIARVEISEVPLAKNTTKTN